jgi:hypothetical protein
VSLDQGFATFSRPGATSSLSTRGLPGLACTPSRQFTENTAKLLSHTSSHISQLNKFLYKYVDVLFLLVIHLQLIFDLLLAPASRPALGPTQPPIQWVPGVLSPGAKRGRGVTLTAHPHLVPRLRMSRSYTSSPPMCLHGV